MLTGVKSKLNSKHGASVMLALLLLLVCVFAGTAALTAAGSNMERYDYMRDHQQQYLTVCSAARLLTDQLDEAAEKPVTAEFEYIGTADPKCTYYYSGIVANIFGPPENGAYQLIWRDIETMIYTAFYNSYAVKGARESGTGVWADIAEPAELAADPKRYTVMVDGDDVLKNYPVDLEIMSVIDNSGDRMDHGTIGFHLTCGECSVSFNIGYSVIIEPPDVDATVINARCEIDASNAFIRMGESS